MEISNVLIGLVSLYFGLGTGYMVSAVRGNNVIYWKDSKEPLESNEMLMFMILTFFVWPFHHTKKFNNTYVITSTGMGI